MSTGERLAYMANQIARNLAARGPEAAAREVADHINAYWTGRMKERLFDMDGLDPIAARAVAILKQRGAPPSQTPATVFAGGSDAG